jgi:nickel-dependent lactate racemase
MPGQDRRSLSSTRMKTWRQIEIEFGPETLNVKVPPTCSILTMQEIPHVTHPREAVREALSQPIGCGSLSSVIHNKDGRPGNLTVAIAVSDITRPVPYRGNDGILPPLLEALDRCGVVKKNVTIIVATGMHRPSTREEKSEILGDEVLRRYRVIDHDCEDGCSLVPVGVTRYGTNVSVNRVFHSADVKIITGLVESHFMTGVSGGRKTICPGLVDRCTIERFHGPEFLESPHASNLILKGNPCHEEATQIARMVGVDFSLNVTLDRHMRLTGVFAGAMEPALARATEKIRQYVEIPLDKTFDIVLTHGGYVGRDHYQTAKAAVGALPAVRHGGTIIIAASNHDAEPIGGFEYRTLLHLLRLQGHEGYLRLLKAPFWKFTKDQWEPQMWGKVLRKVGEQGLIYCSPDIPVDTAALLPGVSGWTLLTQAETQGSRRRIAQAMVQQAVIHAHQRGEVQGARPRMAFVSEGPYAIPHLIEKD